MIGVVEAIERGYRYGERGVGKEPHPDESSTKRPILVLHTSSVRVHRRNWETTHVHAGWVWRDVLFERRYGTLDYDLETLIQLILALKTGLGQLDLLETA